MFNNVISLFPKIVNSKLVDSKIEANNGALGRALEAVRPNVDATLDKYTLEKGNATMLVNITLALVVPDNAGLSDEDRVIIKKAIQDEIGSYL